MPSTSQRQHNFMEMVAHDPEKAKAVGVPQSVGKEFVLADIGRQLGPIKKAPKKKMKR